MDIIYEDEYHVVINKPPNMVVHPACGNLRGTLVNALVSRFNLPTKNQEKSAWIRPGLVHRLDKETSGIILIAKTEESLYNLSKQFENRTIKKTYRAICFAKNNIDEGIINIAIARDKNNRKKMRVASNHEEAKPAKTYFKVIKKLKNNIVLIEANPETGRTHQIRVHLSHVGYPILGDSVYGMQYEGINRTMLHAYKIEFSHPVKSDKISFISNYYEDFENILKIYGE